MDTNALATVAQWQFVELLLEVVQETFVLAIFFFVGKGIQSKEGPGPQISVSGHPNAARCSNLTTEKSFFEVHLIEYYNY